jgi:Tfp pilus assembly protein PilE
MNNQNYLSLIMILIAIIIVAILAWFKTGDYLNLQEEKLKNEAVQGCLLVGQDEYLYPENNSKAVVPNLKAYRQCMDEKGY